jgi:integrase
MAESQSLLDLFENLFLPLRLRSKSENTVRLYRHTLRSFGRHLGRIPRLDDLEDSIVACYLVAYQVGRSPHSVERERCTLLSLWRFAARRALVARWPDIEPTKLPKRVPEAWTEDQLRRIFATIAKLTGCIGMIPSRDWWACLHWIAWDTGERISAITGVDWRDVDLKRRMIVCRAETRKGGREDRLYEVSTECIDSIRRCRVGVGSGLVLPWPLARTYLWQRYAVILRQAGLPADSRSKFHRIRRSVASHLEAVGGNAT